MTVYRFRMIVFAVSLFFALAFVSRPAQAQNPGGGPPAGAGANIQSLASDLAALTARVDKLEGNIVAADLVGTYSVAYIQNELVPGFPAKVGSYVGVGTVTLAADGTGTTDVTEKGSHLIQGSPWFLFPHDVSKGPETFNWTYSDSKVYVGDTVVNIAAGGRLAFFASPGDGHAPALWILARLK